jgi:hypothetical protein
MTKENTSTANSGTKTIASRLEAINASLIKSAESQELGVDLLLNEIDGYEDEKCRGFEFTEKDTTAQPAEEELAAISIPEGVKANDAELVESLLATIEARIAKAENALDAAFVITLNWIDFNEKKRGK